MSGMLISPQFLSQLKQMWAWFVRNRNRLSQPPRARPIHLPGDNKIRIFEVQTSATGDGVYNCFEQSLDSTEWEDTSGNDKLDNKEASGEETEIEILNLLENDPLATFAGGLRAGDRLAAWKIADDEKIQRWVGTPISVFGNVRLAKTQVAAGSGSTIACKIVDENEVEITGPTTVNCRIAGGGGLNAATPRLPISFLIAVQNIGGKWWAVDTFQATESCICT